MYQTESPCFSFTSIQNTQKICYNWKTDKLVTKKLKLWQK